MNNEHEPLTYFEKLENVYILLETKQMLEAKLKESQASIQEKSILEDDLRKIHEEILEYTNGYQIEPEQMSVSSLFNPGIDADNE
ncbi:hypothetical protein [Halalkalibacter krulwichiae]|uniref:Uncharacterized protein n=1 Tax=Halalkalibacter krulwichiae TaxID=199441 RepID=A0A1X9ME99_9BACI|nr:hypothetical protein [Halalkalibacter krulwichiae]ARK30463.1 hypothetical protein BkAM31D_11840 [Halalkalibacter krulwichiae]